MIKDFEIVPHTADIKIRAYGFTFEEVFKNALKGMFASIKPCSQRIKYIDDKINISKYDIEHRVVVKSLNINLLLIDFLSKCLYLSDLHNEAYFDVRFNVFSSDELECVIFGVKIKGFEVAEIKAITYHGFEFEQIDDTWIVTLGFDI